MEHSSTKKANWYMNPIRKTDDVIKSELRLSTDYCGSMEPLGPGKQELFGNLRYLLQRLRRLLVLGGQREKIFIRRNVFMLLSRITH